MEEQTLQKRVWKMPTPQKLVDTVQNPYRQKRVAAYCRVSTEQEEQLNSYEVQVKSYTEKIHAEPGWKLVGIYADRGISGTSVKHREEFQHMIRHCRQGRIDMILTKSISRFARNTVDCLKYVRLLKSLNVDVFFEEQGIHSTDPGAEFYITIYGSLAQSESENISANVRWGKEQAAKQGNVPFPTKNFLGYSREPGKKTPVIVEEEAAVIRRIYADYLAGNSLPAIAKHLNAEGVQTPSGKGQWQPGTIKSILTNEKYKGDAILNRTYVEDCISKKVKRNEGERPMYYVENNHPAIIDKETFGQVQQEMARRNNLLRKSEQHAKTQLGKYSSKYALTELLICGDCGTPYRRCTWTHHGGKEIVWRCIQRIETASKECQAPTMKEPALQETILEAIREKARQDPDVLRILKEHIAQGLARAEDTDREFALLNRMQEIQNEFQTLTEEVTANNIDSMDEGHIQALLEENQQLEREYTELTSRAYADERNRRLDNLSVILDGIQNHPMTWDEKMIRQLIAGVMVLSKDRLKIAFTDGSEVEKAVVYD